jgi:hypothetical protein
VNAARGQILAREQSRRRTCCLRPMIAAALATGVTALALDHTPSGRGLDCRINGMIGNNGLAWHGSSFHVEEPQIEKATSTLVQR